MSFLSLQFFALCFCTVAVYYLLPRKKQWYALLAASLYFYLVSAGAVSLLIALATAVFTWGAALRLEAAAADRKKKRLALSIAVIAVTGILALFKAGSLLPGLTGRLLAPLGISYYSLSLIGYLVDVYYKKQAAEHSVLRMVLYTLYFPKIMQGPISKFRELGPRLTEGHAFDWRCFCFGLQRMLWGYFKKMAIADLAAPIVENVFGDLAGYDSGGCVLVLVTLIAVVRHYCDFSGYMDIVIGLSQALGIELEENFRQPFFSRSAAEFWRRWHITLGVWFKDYIYMPLVIHPRVIALSGRMRRRFGKRAGKEVLSVIPLAGVWLLTGLWHGTGWDYILWGAYWGALIIFSNVFAPEIKKLDKALHIPTASPLWRLFQTLRTFGLFTFGLLISTFAGCRHLGTYFVKLFSEIHLDKLFDGTLFTLGQSKTYTLPMLYGILILFCVEVWQQKGSVRAKVAELKAPLRWLIYAAAIVAVVVISRLNGDGIRVFGYVRF